MTRPLRVHIYSDGADVRDMVAARDSGIVKGFTTNPTLKMFCDDARAAGYRL